MSRPRATAPSSYRIGMVFLQCGRAAGCLTCRIESRFGNLPARLPPSGGKIAAMAEKVNAVAWRVRNRRMESREIANGLYCLLGLCFQTSGHHEMTQTIAA